ncbi:hypothetical protein GFL84_29250 [Rhizobium leguminosarum bv. viciae]|nr:hypothetical protein [Rhizobium leguminosarum bv. viciae]
MECRSIFSMHGPSMIGGESALSGRGPLIWHSPFAVRVVCFSAAAISTMMGRWNDGDARHDRSYHHCSE